MLVQRLFPNKSSDVKAAQDEMLNLSVPVAFRRRNFDRNHAPDPDAGTRKDGIHRKKKQSHKNCVVTETESKSIEYADIHPEQGEADASSKSMGENRQHSRAFNDERAGLKQSCDTAVRENQVSHPRLGSPPQIQPQLQ